MSERSPARWANAVADIVQTEVKSHHVPFSTRHRIAEETWALAMQWAEEIGCAAIAAREPVDAACRDAYNAAHRTMYHQRKERT